MAVPQFSERGISMVGHEQNNAARDFSVVVQKESLVPEIAQVENTAFETDETSQKYLDLFKGATPEMAAVLQEKIVPLLQKKRADLTSYKSAINQISDAFEMGSQYPIQFYMGIKRSEGVRMITAECSNGQIDLFVDETGFLVLGAFTKVAKDQQTTQSGKMRSWRGIVQTAIDELGESRLVSEGAIYNPDNSSRKRNKIPDEISNDTGGSSSIRGRTEIFEGRKSSNTIEIVDFSPAQLARTVPEHKEDKQDIVSSSETEGREQQYLALIDGAEPEMHALLQEKILPLLLVKENSHTSLRGAIKEVVKALDMQPKLVDQIYMYFYQIGGVKTNSITSGRKIITMVEPDGFLAVGAFVATVGEYDKKHPNKQREGRGEDGLYRTALKALGESSLVRDKALYYPYSDGSDARWAATNSVKLARKRPLGETFFKSLTSADTSNGVTSEGGTSFALPKSSTAHTEPSTQAPLPPGISAGKGDDEAIGFPNPAARTENTKEIPDGDEIEEDAGFPVTPPLFDSAVSQGQTRQEAAQIPLEQLMVTVEDLRPVQRGVVTGVVFDSGKATSSLGKTFTEHLSEGTEATQQVIAEVRETVLRDKQAKDENAKLRKEIEARGEVYIPEIPGFVDDTSQTTESLKPGDMLRDKDGIMGTCERLAEIDGQLYITVSDPTTKVKRSVPAVGLGKRYFRLRSTSA